VLNPLVVVQSESIVFESWAGVIVSPKPWRPSRAPSRAPVVLPRERMASHVPVTSKSPPTASCGPCPPYAC
jgi:hypothetical protein